MCPAVNDCSSGWKHIKREASLATSLETHLEVRPLLAAPRRASPCHRSNETLIIIFFVQVNFKFENCTWWERSASSWGIVTSSLPEQDVRDEVKLIKLNMLVLFLQEVSWQRHETQHRCISAEKDGEHGERKFSQLLLWNVAAGLLVRLRFLKEKTFFKSFNRTVKILRGYWRRSVSGQFVCMKETFDKDI